MKSKDDPYFCIICGRELDDDDMVSVFNAPNPVKGDDGNLYINTVLIGQKCCLEKYRERVDAIEYGSWVRVLSEGLDD